MKYITSLFLFLALTAPNFVLAQDPASLVTCKDGGECNFCSFIEMVRVISIWLLIVAALIGVILIMYAGYRMTASRGDIAVVTEARKIIGNVAIGIFIIVLATTIVDVIMQTATGKGFGVWNKPANCGESFKTRGLVDEPIKTGIHPGVTVPANDGGVDGNLGEFGGAGVYIPLSSNSSAYDGLDDTDGFVDVNGFIDAPYPDSNESYVDTDGFINAPYPDTI